MNGCEHGFPDPHGVSGDIALGPCPTCILCEQCGEAPIETREWGPWLCAGCSEMTARGDGGET